MNRSLKRLRIIGAVLLAAALAGCGLNMLRLSYGQAPTLAYWWLDDYTDFDAIQKPKVRQAIDDWFRWHRRTQLGDYADLLVRAQAQVLEPTTPAAVCQWQTELQRRAGTAFEHAVAPMAELAGSLSGEQIEHVERRFTKSNKEFRDDFLQPDPKERLEAAVERSVKRAKMLYGSFDDAQLERIERGVAASPFNAEMWFAERRARQQDMLRLLRSLEREPNAAPAEAQAGLRTLAEHMLKSPNPPYRAYQEKLADYNCAFAAQIHNATTAAQRQVALKKLKGWEDDLRSLMGAPAPAATGAAASPGTPLAAPLASPLTAPLTSTVTARPSARAPSAG